MTIPLLRPNTVAVFAKVSPTDAGLVAEVTAFLLTLAVVAEVPGRFRFDTVGSYSANLRHSLARNPLERMTANNIIREPRTLSVTGTVSATPLTGFGLLGVAGSLIRRDINAVASLRTLAEIGEPLVVVTPSEVFGSMGLVSVQETHPGSNKIDVALMFEEIVIVNPASVAGAVDITAATFGAAQTENMGAQPVDAAADPGGLV